MSVIPLTIVRRPGAPRRLAFLVLAGWLCAAPAAATAATEEVVVERVKPKKIQHATLRFLKENRAFLRARLDLLRQRPVGGRADAVDVDPGLLDYPAMLAAIQSSSDSITHSEYQRQAQDLFRDVGQLAALEGQLDLMERQLDLQRDRLARLQEDFVGAQRTALIVVLSGAPSAMTPTEIAITIEGGPTLAVPLDHAQKASLRQGGIVQVFHGFVEPREQVVEASLRCDRWPEAQSGFVTLDLTRDRLTFLRLDLSQLGPDGDIAAIRASTWLHDSRLAQGD